MNDTTSQIVKALKNSQVVILPSDTLYGPEANAYDAQAVSKVFAIKQRQIEKKLPIHYHSLEQMDNDIIITPLIEKLVQKFMPGGLTIIANKKSNSKLKFIENTVGFRIPNHKTLPEIIKQLGMPVTMPSANISNAPPSMRFAEIAQELNIKGIEDDASLCAIPSTIIDATTLEVKLVRHGKIAWNQILEAMR